jgi:hypothetical protein
VLDEKLCRAWDGVKVASQKCDALGDDESRTGGKMDGQEMESMCFAESRSSESMSFSIMCICSDSLKWATEQRG